MCNSLGDIIGASAKVLGNATAAGGNETSSMQGMMASGMQNMSQSELQGLNTLYDKLITALRTAVDNDGVLDK
jgi:hypothetical protein